MLSSSMCPVVFCVCFFFCLVFFFQKETRACKQGGSWRSAVVQLLKQLFGRVAELCAAHGVFPAVGGTVKRFCSAAETCCKGMNLLE